MKTILKIVAVVLFVAGMLQIIDPASKGSNLASYLLGKDAHAASGDGDGPGV